MRDYPAIFLEFSNYKIAVQGRSKLTVEQYLLDLDQFFRYLICSRKHRNNRFSIEEFEAQTGIRLDKRKVNLPVEITGLGVYIAVVDLHKEVKANLEINILEK